MEASDPGWKPVPEMVAVAPPLTLVHTGMAGFELLHVAPGMESDRVVAAYAFSTLVASSTPPAMTATKPTDANSLDVRLMRSTFPP
jgi:hypothetical protein